MNRKKVINRAIIKKDLKSQLLIQCILFLILLIPNFYTLFYATDLQNSLKLKLSYLVLSLLVWLFPFIIFNTKTYFRIGILFLLISPLEIGFVKTTGLPINIGFMESVFNSNFLEIKEQLSSNILELSFLGLILIIYCYLITFVDRINIKLKVKFYFILAFLAINSVLFYSMYNLLSKEINLKDRLDISLENTTKKYKKVFPTNFIINGINAIEANESNKALAKEINNFTFNAKEISHNNENEIYILVIGETARRHNFHLYGYERPTTPHLDKIENIIAFSNVNSAATLTLQSIPQIITRANPDQLNLQYKEKTILDAFKESGYYTAWIGVQNISTPLVKRLKSVADYTYFTQSDISSGNFYDMDILKKINQIIENKENKKKFIIIHTLGSHFRYSNRYTEDFEKFTPTISKSGYTNIGLDSKEKLINAYDNSILYTDYFLSSLINNVQKSNSISGLFYLSDHGENLYDDNKTIFHGSENPTKFEYEIPYIVWYSNKYKDFYPNKVQAMHNNKDKKAVSTSTFYSLLEMANISYDNSNKEIYKSLLNSGYKEPVKRKLVNSKNEIITVD